LDARGFSDLQQLVDDLLDERAGGRILDNTPVMRPAESV